MVLPFPLPHHFLTPPCEQHACMFLPAYPYTPLTTYSEWALSASKNMRLPGAGEEEAEVASLLYQEAFWQEKNDNCWAVRC